MGMMQTRDVASVCWLAWHSCFGNGTVSRLSRQRTNSQFFVPGGRFNEISGRSPKSLRKNEAQDEVQSSEVGSAPASSKKLQVSRLEMLSIGKRIIQTTIPNQRSPGASAPLKLIDWYTDHWHERT